MPVTKIHAPTPPVQSASPVVRRGPVTVEYLREHPTVSVEQAAMLLGLSRAYCYELARTDKLEILKLGTTRVRVKSTSLLRMLGED
ncbi:MAG: hypothetical protein QG597_3805 [Actinomycetota bacterium]|nr:hypothetical protein [Actinomycetota bacterium]